MERERRRIREKQRQDKKGREVQETVVRWQAQRERPKYTGPLTRRSLWKTPVSLCISAVSSVCVCAHTHVTMLATQDEVIKKIKNVEKVKLKGFVCVCVYMSVCVCAERE